MVNSNLKRIKGHHMMIKIEADQGIKALTTFCNERNLDKDKVFNLFEFLAFIRIGTRGMLNMIKEPNLMEIDLPEEAGSAITALSSEHGPIIVKAMIINRYTPSKWPVLRLRKWKYLMTAFVMSLYYEVKERIVGL